MASQLDLSPFFFPAPPPHCCSATRSHTLTELCWRVCARDRSHVRWQTEIVPSCWRRGELKVRHILDNKLHLFWEILQPVSDYYIRNTDWPLASLQLIRKEYRTQIIKHLTTNILYKTIWDTVVGAKKAINRNEIAAFVLFYTPWRSICEPCASWTSPLRHFLVDIITSPLSAATALTEMFMKSRKASHTSPRVEVHNKNFWTHRWGPTKCGVYHSVKPASPVDRITSGCVWYDIDMIWLLSLFLTMLRYINAALRLLWRHPYF